MSIRPIAICLFRDGDRILVSEGFDSVNQSFFYRPLGGGIEYGETSEAAILREIEEEISAEVENIRLIHILENIFTQNGEQGHEIVFLFDGEFSDKTLYDQVEIDCYEQESDIRFKGIWKSLADIEKNNGRLVPEGLAKLLHR